MLLANRKMNIAEKIYNYIENMYAQTIPIISSTFDHATVSATVICSVNYVHQQRAD